MAKRKCRHCKEFFDVGGGIKVPLGFFCSMAHVTEHGIQRQKAEKEKKERAKHKEAKEKLKSRGDYAKEAQAEFNRYIRLRDGKHPCISCGRHHSGQYHAGHYRTVGGHPELRFNEFNCHKQCSVCNNHKSGNIVEYRINLKTRIGEQQLDWLEGPHETKKYTIEELKEIKFKYRKLANDLAKDK